MSMEADVYPFVPPSAIVSEDEALQRTQDGSEQIEASIGEGSAFHDNFGYYAQGVGPETAVLPEDWESRLVRIQNANTNDRSGYCIDPVDLFLAKAAAGREKDKEFCVALVHYQHVAPAQALKLVEKMPLDSRQQRDLRARIRRWLTF